MSRLGMMIFVLVGLAMMPAAAIAREEGTPAPLDNETVQHLAIFGFPPGVTPGTFQLTAQGATIAIHAGDSVDLVLGEFVDDVCGGTGFRCFVPMSIPATWSVVPADGARIEAETGLLTIDAATASGSVYTVQAAVDGGRRIVETEIHVYTPEGNPLVGYWQEVAQLSCATGAEVAPALPIEELVFGADGTYSVTWTPFESYLDYWGTYAFDPAQGTLELSVTYGNNVPPDVDGNGTFAVAEGKRLILTDLWLGSSREDQGPANCGHVFAG
jgi:hypothetical protein